MPYQAPLPLTDISPSTIDDLLRDPARARDLVIDSMAELLARIAGRVAALKTLEGTLLSMMLSQRVATSNGKNGESALLNAPQVAKLFDVPESWVREQGRLGPLPSIRLGHYVRFKAEEIQRFVAERETGGMRAFRR
jgi:predicted DNA-binding transcriptional regulator AlpA